MLILLVDLRFGWLNVPGNQNVLCVEASCWPSSLECIKYNCSVHGLNLAEELCHITIYVFLFIINHHLLTTVGWRQNVINLNNKYSACSTHSDCMVSVFKTTNMDIMHKDECPSIVINFTKVTDELAFLFDSV